MIQFSLAVFLSAFLLFQVQPIIARYILPAFGGSPAVWTACMMFFQVALLSYPTLFEPQFTIDAQAGTWSVLYVALASICVWCGISYWKSGEPVQQETRSPKASVRPVSTLDRVLWVALAACGSTILLAMTKHICQDVAVVPFLWILPLSLYLLSFIICFDKDDWYQRPIWITLLVVSLIPMLQLMFPEYTAESQTLVYQVSVFSVVLFACCMVCHGELARRRSAVSHLTTFYLYVALGGVFVNLVAPLLFPGFWELHVALAGTFILAGICVGIDKKVVKTKQDRQGCHKYQSRLFWRHDCLRDGRSIAGS